MNIIWEEAKDQIKSILPEKTFSLWINPLTFLEQKENTLLVGCPNKFSLNWIMENYRGIIQERLDAIGNGDCKLSLTVKIPEKRKSSPDFESDSKQLTFPNMRRPNGPVRASLNNSFTFDRFVVGECNEFAYSASKALALGESRSYNPLFILANTGLGKSHLSQAIGHAIISHDPKLSVYYITAEGFVNEMITALKNNRIEEFKDKYRRCCDVLLLEEIHFLSGKEKIQSELGYTLDALANDHKKIIFTSSLLPKDVPRMTKELSSRLTSGVITTLDKPDYNTRIRILQKKSSEQNMVLSEEILHLFAKHLTGDVRHMESSLRCLKARSELLNEETDLNLAKEVLKSHVTSHCGITMKDIKTLVCQYFKVEPSVLQSRSRKKIHAYPRNIYVYLCRRHTETTLETIGESIDRNHSTALYASEVIEHKLKVDYKIKKEIGFLSQKLEDMTK